MVPSRALLFLVAALALPLSVFTGCGDDSDPKDDESPTDESPADDDDDKVGETADARVKPMDGSTKSDAGDDKVDSSTGDKPDAGETTIDSGISPNDGGSEDAKVDGIDAAQDSGKEDATVDSSSADAGNDGGEEDAGEKDAAQDAAQQDSGTDAGTDAGQEYTEAECTEAGGEKLDEDENCDANQTEYDLVGDEICCVDKPEPSEDGTCGGIQGIPCKMGEFCDVSTFAGGTGCGVTDGLGKCRAKPTQCEGIFGLLGCGCNGIFYTNSCTAYKDGISVEIGASAPCIQ
jgi:hypothetical protein